MSPMEFSIAVAAWREDQKDKNQRDIAVAWMTASFATQAFANKLPPLQTFIPALAANLRSQDARLEAAAATMGLKVVRPHEQAA